MKPDRSQRRSSTTANRRSSASSILSRRMDTGPSEVYTEFPWLLLLATMLTIVLISFLFTPYTHQLDEIKNVLLMFAPPFLLLGALWKMDFSAISWKNQGAFILLGLYFASMCLSWALNPYKLTGETVIWFNLGVATFTVVFAWYMNTENRARKIMIFFVWLGLVSTLIGLFLYAGRFSDEFKVKFRNDPLLSTLFYTLASSHSEMYSFILNADFYAAFLVMLIPISLSMFFVEQRFTFKVMALASFLLMNICLVFTNSNDSFIAMSIAYPFYFIMGFLYVKNWGLSRRFITALGVCLLITVILCTVLMWPKVMAALDFKSEAFGGRRVLWGGGFWPWLYGQHFDGSSPDWRSVFFGTGPGGYRHYFPWYRRPDFFDNQINNVTTFAHNFYLDTLLEQGLLGLTIFVAFVVRVFNDGLRQIRTTTSRTHLFYQLAVLTGILGIALQSFSSPNNRWAVAGMTYWCMFGLSMALFSLDNPPVHGSNSHARIGKIHVWQIAKVACFILAGLFFSRSVAPGFQFSKYWTAAKLNAEGLRAMESAPSYPERKNELLNAAKSRFEDAIKLNPTFATSYYKLGHVYNQLDMPDQAIKCYEELDKVFANYSEVQLNLGIMYAQKSGTLSQEGQRKNQQAQELLQKMQTAKGADKTKLETEYQGLMEDISTIQKNLPKLEQDYMATAYSHMREAAHQSLKPNTQYMAGMIGEELAELYDKAGNERLAETVRQDAKKYYWSVLNYHPKLEELQVDQKNYYPRAQTALLRLGLMTGNMQEVIDVLKRRVKDNPDDDKVLRQLLAAYDEDGRIKDKLEYLENAVHADPTDVELRAELAKAYQKAGDQEKYRLELRRVERLAPNDKSVLKSLYAAAKSAKDEAALTGYADKLTSLGVSLAELNAEELKTTAVDEPTTTVDVPTTPTASPPAAPQL